MKQIIVNNEAGTARLARILAGNFQGGETIELLGDLGSGKTTFTRYLVEALGGGDVTSPSFTISNIYKLNTDSLIREVWHFDFYRLSDAGVVGNELAEVVTQPDKLVIVEWAQTVESSLPVERLKFEFTGLGGDKRQLKLVYPDSLKYIVEGIK